MEQGRTPRPGEGEEVVHSEREVIPAEVEERVERLGTWAYAGAGLAVLAAIVAIVALVFVLSDDDGDGEGADPQAVERLRDEVRELDGSLDEVRDQAAAGAEAEGRVDELQGSVSDLQESVDQTSGSVSELSDQVETLQEDVAELRTEVEQQQQSDGGQSDGEP